MVYKIVYLGIAFLLGNIVTAIAFYYDDRSDKK